MRVEEYVARGLSPDDARQLATRRFGDADRARNECVTIDEEVARTHGTRRVRHHAAAGHRRSPCGCFVGSAFLRCSLSLSRARHRRDDEHVQRRQRAVAAPNAVSPRRAADVSRHHAARRTFGDRQLVPGLPRLARPAAQLRRPCRVRDDESHRARARTRIWRTDSSSARATSMCSA